MLKINLILLTLLLTFGLNSHMPINAQFFRQFFNRWQGAGRGWQQPVGNCLTPNNYYGFCVPLSYCPFYEVGNRPNEYVAAAERNCGGNKYNGKYLLCCSNPIATLSTTETSEVEAIIAESTTTTTTQLIKITQATSTPMTVSAAPLIHAIGTRCVGPDKREGVCIELRQCTVLLTQLTENPNDPTFAQFLRHSKSICSAGNQIVCCPNDYEVDSPENPIIEVTPTPTPLTTTITTTTSTTTTPAPHPPTIETAPLTSTNLADKRGEYCVGKDKRGGFCKFLSNCPELRKKYPNQNDAIFAKFLNESHIICGGNKVVCCPDATNYRVLPTVEQHCGQRPMVKIEIRRIVGGSKAKENAWPWIALLHYNDVLSTTSFKCGGTLITARHVLTAAHCINKNLDLVRLGEYDLSTVTEAKTVDIPIANKISHSDYNKSTGRSDIAILYLKHNAPISALIRPICLPYTNELQTKSYVSFQSLVAGWGRTLEGGSTSNVLQELKLPVLNNAVCRDSYAKMKALKSADQFDNSVICAGELDGGKDTCQGDSGGPLVVSETYQKNPRYYLIGIVSYGIGCARKDIPGVYTSTQYFMPWIREKVAKTP